MARSRTGKVKKTLPEPDPIYGNRLLSRFINRVMKHGKKTIAQNLIYKALDEIKKEDQDPIAVFEQAVKNVSPRVEVRPRRVGGASYQVPIEVRGDRRVSLAIRWLVTAARKRSNKEYKTFDKKLSAELMDAFQNQGEAVRKKDLMHKMAESNRAFAHFRW